MEVIKIKDEHKTVIKGFKDVENDAQMAFQHSTMLMRKANGNIWKFIHEHYPATADYNCSYDHETGELTLRYLDIKTD